MQKKLLFAAVSIGVGAVLGVVAGRPVQAQEASRYPYDPVCPWGRIANGSGMLVRCIVETEASQLLSSSPPTASSTKPAASSSASASAAPSASASSSAPITAQDLSLKIGPITPDQGALPQAEKKLSAAKEKLIACIVDNGGMEKDSAEVHVRFLISDRGRAEGVSVQKKSGVGTKAATCVADVLDRRSVGTPEVSMVGATAVFKFSRVKR